MGGIVGVLGGSAVYAAISGVRRTPVVQKSENKPITTAEYNRRFDRFELTGTEKGEKGGKAAEGSKAGGSDKTSAECQTCANRKYVDGSNDPGVSFKTPTSVDPDAAASAVRSHEYEHVKNNAAEAEEKGLTAHSSVSIHTAICPECGKVYVSGGTTTTTFSPKKDNDLAKKFAVGIEDQSNKKTQEFAA
ncbi:MAG: hypothetical protein LBL98_05965 [Ruminococcus sp.]|jgi:hypothetical protein|nr:hypothetical protein [Ruminococcus sp.]